MAYHIQDLQLGMSASTAKTVTEADIILFAGISTDVNPAHLDEEYAKGTMFGGRIAHGMLSAGFISAVLANKLPGPGTIYLSQTLKFKAPVRPRRHRHGHRDRQGSQRGQEPRGPGHRVHRRRQGGDRGRMPDDAPGQAGGLTPQAGIALPQAGLPAPNGPLRVHCGGPLLFPAVPATVPSETP